MDYTRIYKELQDYSIDDYDTFINNIEKSYKDLTNSSYTIDNSNCPVLDFDSFDADDLHDRFAISCNSVRFDCLLTPSATPADTLFIIFSGSRNIETDRLPMFKRWSYHRFIDSMVLNIADPMFYKYEKLKIGWYYGNQTESYIEYLSKIIKKIQLLFGIENNKLFFFGSSGGGYVSLQLSMYFQETTHIAINPQISIFRYHYAKKFNELTGINLKARDSFRRNETAKIVIERSRQNLNKFFIIQNANDEHHCKKHLFPVLSKLNINSLHPGINSFDHMYIWLYSCVGGHSVQGDQFIFSYIVYLAEKISKDEKITPSDEFIFKNISILWKQKEYFKQISQANAVSRTDTENSKNAFQPKTCNNTDDETAENRFAKLFHILLRYIKTDK